MQHPFQAGGRCLPGFVSRICHGRDITIRAVTKLRTHHRLMTWLAILVVSLGALVPALVQAAQPTSSAAAWLEICTAKGMVRLDSLVSTPPATGEPAEREPASESVNPWNPCGWCMQHTTGLALPPPALAPWALPDRLTDRPPAFYRNPSPSFVWVAPLSRAPPIQG